MPPTVEGTPPDFRPPHRAIAYSVARGRLPEDGDWPLFYGGCLAGDFYATEHHSTKAEAEADVQAHLLDVQQRPHRALVNMLRTADGYIGFCNAGDFSPLIARRSRAEAEADVAAHLAAVLDFPRE